ncbi:adenosylcobinamide-GDP ribazoletransferase [Aneurinibacillus thermoaerophilus]|uniref:adenosylcobinamide-GDP ribazoletransferase n=1 Tax=Aneurinibacillus thermoaerophilus TaxID=143495 RepID=UPI002E1A90C3|nr:adenosylcobinamide-GDP ribazoletransferase [Aneurinibacillus thermoaerophilus]MED0737056.1 adenosylcobinamide-GDP ribazoletransferase [Aneurinibacillus thermoaerophilus]MED0757374.1 adenosylcobinamide-GDP ribazoletransferase [Aneurinibacillus thermoaerophilus]MED0762089.1 adenosylcobinamide-GDP ribazoletransferase [Aneurinibacillus thermoaerophilus]
MNAFFHAVAFLTRIPVPRLTDDMKDWQRSVAFYPAVGLLLGILLCGAAFVAFWLLPVPVAAVIVLVGWVYSTGALHLDGWMDLADGLGSYRDRERVFAIMKDSRVGAMGVTAAILLFMVKVAALYEIIASGLLVWLILPPLLARTGLTAAIWFWPYITEKGLGTGLRGGLTEWRVAAGFLLAVGFAFALYGIAGLLVSFVVAVCDWLFLRMVARRLGGLTGDCYGAQVEWAEAVTLVCIVIAGRFCA